MATGDGILTLAAQRLTDFLIQEATFLLGVNDEMVSIRDELIWMQSFLEDAEQRQGTDKRIRQWIAEIRSIALKAEDIIDDYYTEVKGKEPSKRKLLTTSLRKCCCIAGETNIYDIGKDIKALKQRLSDIKIKREVFGINDIGSTQEKAHVGLHDQLQRDLRRTVGLTEEEDFVDFDDNVKMLETQLFLSEWRRTVISIWGMGGLGKTSLAKKLFQTNKCWFELHAWVSVSQEWNTKDLLARIITSFIRTPTYEELIMLEKMTDDSMKRYLRNLLKDKRYLLVIDDTWDEDVWRYLRKALPDDQNRSRVIITTRNESVAKLLDERTYVHKLRRLREDESWELFCKKVYPYQNGACPEDSEKIGKEMVAKCDGLPLAIIVLGGLLSRKQSHEWHLIKHHIWKSLIDRSDHISSLLELSYNDLSRELKSCFLYLGIFPEDYKIYSENLIQLWIAEDLIPPNKGLDLEELAESYIKELNARSLIMLNGEHDFPTSTCHVHDLLRDLAVNKAKELDFFHIYDESVSPSTKPFSTRRIAFRSGFERCMAIDHSHTRVHTLSFLNYYNRCLDVTKFLTLINTRFKSLRVLDLEGVKIENTESKLKLFEAIGKLVHLRYIGLFGTDMNELPESIGNLHALQTLDVYNMVDKSILLPRDMYKLKQLRHLKGLFITKKGDIIVPPISFEDLTNLHSLKEIDINGWLTNEESDEFALKAFSKLCNIRTLTVRFVNTNYRLSIEPLFSCKNLFSLELYGSIKSLPMEMHESLPNLRYLSLYNAKFVQDPLPALEKLVNLLVLKLSGFEMKSLIITATGFYKLETLSIIQILEDMNLHIEEGALPSLKRIHLYPSENFTLPERLKNMTF